MIEIFIPLLPPGLNESYGLSQRDYFDPNLKAIVRKSYMYKTKVARDWEKDAALIIGSEAAIQGWEDNQEWYEIEVKFSNWNQDVDAPLKLIIDCISQKLGFNDKKIRKQSSEKVDLKEKGVLIRLGGPSEIFGVNRKQQENS